MRYDSIKSAVQLLLCCSLAVVTACGGGGGGSGGGDANESATTSPPPSAPATTNNTDGETPAWLCPAEPINIGSNEGEFVDLAVAPVGSLFQLRIGVASTVLAWQQDAWQEVWRELDIQAYSINWHADALWIASSLGLLSVAEEAGRAQIRLEQEVTSMAVAILSDRTVLLALGPAGLFQSLDTGNSWQAEGFDATYTLAGNGKRIYAWKPDTLLASVDGGVSWTDVPLPRSSLADLAVDPRNSGHLVARWQDERLSVSLDGGINWEDTSLLGSAEISDSPPVLSALTIGSFGDYYVVTDGRVLCQSQLHLPKVETLLSSPLVLSLTPHSDRSSAPRFQFDEHTDATITVTITNHSQQPFQRVELELWSLAEPSEFYAAQSEARTYPSLIGRQVIQRLDAGSEAVVDMPWFAAQRTSSLHRLIALATTEGENPGGVMTPVAVTGPSRRVESVIDFDLADLQINTVYLNAVTPYVIIETAVGEERRVTIDVWNRGPDAARNVVVSIPFSHVDVLQGQIFSGSGSCSREVDAFICRASVLEDATTLRIELTIRPRFYLTAMPYTVASDTADPDEVLMPEEHHDMRMELNNVNGGSVQAGASLLIDVLARNAGLESTDEVVLHGFAGPWPQVTQANVNLQTNSCTMVRPPCEGSSCPDAATYPALFTCRIHASSFGGLRPGNAIGNSYDLTAPANGMVALGIWAAAKGMEWNAADNAAALAVDVIE